jgi:hypothetical protein
MILPHLQLFVYNLLNAKINLLRKYKQLLLSLKNQQLALLPLIYVDLL